MHNGLVEGSKLAVEEQVKVELNDDQFSQTQKEITRGRSTVLSYILKLKKCLDARHTDLLETLKQRFSESTIDYISYGHFRLLHEHHLEPHQYAALQSTTQQVLSFDERHLDVSPRGLDALRRDLERVALALETRFEIEDEFLAQTTV